MPSSRAALGLALFPHWFLIFHMSAVVSRHSYLRGFIKPPSFTWIFFVVLLQIIAKSLLYKTSKNFSVFIHSNSVAKLAQGGQIAVVGARVKTVKYMTSSCSFNLSTTFLQHSFPYKLRPNPRPPALC